MAVPAYDGKRQLMVPGGRFMAENDKSCEMVGWQTVFFCSVLSTQSSSFRLLSPDFCSLSSVIS